MKCFYHDDLDGQAAAYCVRRFKNEGTYIPINYNQRFPIELILEDEEIFIVDFSIPPKEMLNLLEITRCIYWIDHHKTAIDTYADFRPVLPGRRKVGTAACELTWVYLFGEEPMPKALRLVGDRDVWTWQFEDETRYFFAARQTFDTRPESFFWELCTETDTGPIWDNLLSTGKIVERYKEATDRGLNQSIGYEAQFGVYHCFACNRARVSSDRFGTRISEYDIILAYYHDGSAWHVSMYSERVDVGELAKNNFGGGGHKGAAGFRCKNLPWVKV